MIPMRDPEWAESVEWFVAIPTDCEQLRKYLEEIVSQRVTPTLWAIPHQPTPAGLDEPMKDLADELWRFCDKAEDVVVLMPACAGWRFMTGAGERVTSHDES
jgi:hypothetical protein